MQDNPSETTPHPSANTRTVLLAMAALGVVFGDIGTSPLYAIQDCFAHHLTPIREHIFGVLSLIFWELVIIVSLKYVFIVMRAGNKGEGGTLALTSLAAGPTGKKATKAIPIILLGFCGAALFFGDSIITPAISVLSAVEGLKVAAPQMEPYILPIALVILLFLFWFQRYGTQKVGAYFGPVMIVWFSILAFMGVRQIIHHPDILHALSPLYALSLLSEHGFFSLTILGSTLLAFTGVEALYADMGHFGRTPIRLSWFAIVFPCLMMNYFGQGALLLANPEAVSNPFFLMVPDSFLLPMVILSAAAAVIASQAVISGAFSLTHQAIQLGYLPRMRVFHTSASEYGQIFIPRVNLILCICVMLLVVLFRSSGALANAYGFAVMGTMVTTTLLVALVSKRIWNWKTYLVVALFLPFLFIDLTFFTTAILKIPHGGWLPLVVGLGLFFIFLTWRKGQAIVTAQREAKAQKLSEFVEQIEKSPYPTVPGTAVYLSAFRAVVPSSLIHNLRHNKVLHERIFILSIHTKEEPRLDEDERLTVKKFPHNIWQIALHYGFMETPNVMEDLQTYLLADYPLERHDTTFFVGHDQFVPGTAPLRPAFRKRLFLGLANSATGLFSYFDLPTDRVVGFGIRVEV